MNDCEKTRQVAELLIRIGWRPNSDAQWYNLQDAMPELRELFDPLMKVLL